MAIEFKKPKVVKWFIEKGCSLARAPETIFKRLPTGAVAPDIDYHWSPPII